MVHLFLGLASVMAAAQSDEHMLDGGRVKNSVQQSTQLSNVSIVWHGVIQMILEAEVFGRDSESSSGT